MPPEVHLTAVGVVVACGVLLAVVCILRWMLRVGGHAPAPLPEDAESAPVVLVPVTQRTPQEALHLAAMLAAQVTAGIVLLHVIEVPYTLPLDVSVVVPDGRSFLRDFRHLLETEGVSVEVKVARSRRAGKAIVDMAQALRPRAVVLSAQPHRGGLGTTASYVLENAASLRVLVYKPSVQAPGPTPSETAASAAR